MNYEEKLSAAIAWMGKRWVFHPERRIRKGDYTTPEIHKADVAATFKREWARLEQDKSQIVRV